MTETIAGRRRLGRGLEALLGPTREEAEREGSLVELAIAEIRPNPYQPRRDVDPAALAELKASILKAGLLQPVVVRTAPGERGSGFELIAGERRLRACQALGWDRIPAVKRDVDDRTVLTLALIENLQRDDLSPVDEARGYERLIAEFSLTHQDVADAVGRDRSTVANALRLLKLPAGVLALLHAAVLLLETCHPSVEELRSHGVPRDRSREQEEQHHQDCNAAGGPFADFEGPQRHPVLTRLELAIGVDDDGDALALHPSNGAPRINSRSRARSSFE